MTPAAHRHFRALRERLGLSQTEVARYMGISREALCRWELHGDRCIGEWRIHRCIDWLAEKVREREAA